ncbi:MAG: hypothetical protein LBO74_03905 [Candidatus Symbiothrix sp.]|jgi:hypothetical protein|nr:hypothetical protein [Candidatus Symbiothrix sp.]
MSKLKFKCTLLTDVIINQKAATDEKQETLDFIPGNNFLGIAAGTLYKDKSEESITIFHSGKVRFGDAHPLYNSFRTLRIPAVMHYPKGKKVSEQDCCYLTHFYDKEVDIKKMEKTKTPQLKQCRSGFYQFLANTVQEVEITKTFAIKSAYDRDLRKSKDMQMYGYQSIDKGNVFCFEVDIDDSLDCLRGKIKDALTGEKRVGRSRSAQYGLVKIEEVSFDEVQSKAIEDKNFITVYADGRLIFLDDNGLPTFTPDVSQLGFPNGKISWEKSQIRTFQYAPWNSKRQVRDTDRCGIEKGSVFVLSVDKIPESLPEYVGSYKNEGFGKIIINPDFLNAKEHTNGLAEYSFSQEKDSSMEKEKRKNEKLSKYDETLLYYLQLSMKEETNNTNIYESVNSYVANHWSKYISDTDSFSSQWGSVRSIAEQSKSKEELKNELFNENSGYLYSGIAKSKWDDHGRRETFETFFKDLKPELAQLTVINLAAEMAKKCSSNKEKEGGNKK